MKISRVTGTTSEILQLWVQDSSSTTGAALVGVTAGSVGFTGYYMRSDQTGPVAVALTAMTAGTFASGGWIAMDATNMPGWYQFGVPNGIFTSGRSAALHLKGVTNMAPLPVEVELTAVNNQSATAFVTSVLLSSGTGTGQLDFTSGVVKSNLVQILATALTETAGLLAGGFKKLFNVASPTGTLNSIPDAVAGATGGLFIAGTNAATTVTTALTTTFTGNLSGSVGSVTGAVGSVTGAVGSVTGLTASDVGAIKTKTDSLTFTVANQVDGNVQSINDVTILGDGSGTPFTV